MNKQLILRVEAINSLRTTINAFMPLLVDDIKTHPVTLKNDGTLNKRTRDRLNAIVQSVPHPTTARIYIDDRMACSLYIKADINYRDARDGSCGCIYYREDQYLVDKHTSIRTIDLTPLPILNFDDVSDDIKQLEELEQQERTIRERKSQLKIRSCLNV